MKTIRFFVVAMAMSLATNVSAQFVESSGGKSGGGFASESAYVDQKKSTNEIDLYMLDGWGVGYQHRREFNPYVGWNVFGFSYMSGFKENSGPAYEGQVNFKFLGARGYTPAWKSIRGYVDLNMGYTLRYSYSDVSWYGGEIAVSHKFGLDFGVGIQVHKNVAIGYNLNVLASGSDETAKRHLFKLSFLF
jgi:hypothetical protein